MCLLIGTLKPPPQKLNKHEVVTLSKMQLNYIKGFFIKIINN